MKQTYDLIIPTGYACSCTQSLRKAGLQFVSFPWDWIADSSPTERCRFICDGFKGFIDMDDLELTGIRNELGNEKVVNRRNGIVFLHDFAFGVPLAEQYQAVAAKYARRAARLDKIIKASRRVLLVTVDAPTAPAPTSVEECENAMSIMARQYPSAHFEYLLVNLHKGRTLENRIDEMPKPGFRRVAFDYKSYDPDSPAYGIEVGMVAAFLKGEYCVREYRTKAEIAAHKAKRRDARNRKLLGKMKELGASNRLEYVLFRVRRVLRRIACAMGPCAVLGRLRRRKFAHVMPIGTNCEPAFRFFLRWGFVESSLFAWASSPGVDALASAIGNLSSLSEGEFKMNLDTNMWESVDSGIRYHGKLQWKKEQGAPQKSLLDKDLADLRGRIRHLADKFARCLSGGEGTLLVYRPTDADVEGGRLAVGLGALEAAIVALGAKNWTLLVVCRAADMVKMPPPSANREYRCVRDFNPREHVTWAELGDPVGWNAIFSEFAPAKVLPKAHAFKFE